ncbi:transposase [Piscirickettsia salmonis]|uniref:transposase n=3 Tax=Piscirickettsia salmonis TaxID=1238 RepID=UPI001013D3C0|nr:transposase [Piscirickettsia salmonis]
MKKSKLSESKIVELLKRVEAGADIETTARDYGISTSTYYTLKERYGAMDISQLKRLKQLEKENQQLKRMYADSQIEIEALKDVVEKKATDIEDKRMLATYLKDEHKLSLVVACNLVTLPRASYYRKNSINLIMLK